MAPAVVELGPSRPLTARDAGADVVINAIPRDAAGGWFLLALFGLPAVGATVGAILMASSRAPGPTLVFVGVAAVCGWLVLGLVRDRLRDRARGAEIAGRRLILRARDALVQGPGDREDVISLAEVMAHPLLHRRPDTFAALVRARQALGDAKPGSPRRLVLEAVAIEAAVVGGFETPRVFVALRRDRDAAAIAAIVKDQASLTTHPDVLVYAVSIAQGAPVMDVGRVIEWKKPAR
jgi:hypothetical protein